MLSELNDDDDDDDSHLQHVVW